MVLFECFFLLFPCVLVALIIEGKEKTNRKDDFRLHTNNESSGACSWVGKHKC